MTTDDEDPPYPVILAIVQISQRRRMKAPTEPSTMPTTVPGDGPVLRSLYVSGIATMVWRRLSRKRGFSSVVGVRDAGEAAAAPRPAKMLDTAAKTTFFTTVADRKS